MIRLLVVFWAHSCDGQNPQLEPQCLTSRILAKVHGLPRDKVYDRHLLSLVKHSTAFTRAHRYNKQKMGGELHKIISWSFWTANLVRASTSIRLHQPWWPLPAVVPYDAAAAAAAPVVLPCTSTCMLIAGGCSIRDHGLGHSHKPCKRFRQPAHSHLEGRTVHRQVLCIKQHLASANCSMCAGRADGRAVQPDELHRPAEVGVCGLAWASARCAARGPVQGSCQHQQQPQDEQQDRHHAC